MSLAFNNSIAVEQSFGSQLAWIGEHRPYLFSLVEAVGVQRGWWRAGRPWFERFARFDPMNSPYCTLLFEREFPTQNLCLVEIHNATPDVLNDWEASATCVPLGWLKFTCFPYDRVLTTLRQVIDREKEGKIVRYRPHLRCTLRVEAENRSPIYAKIFGDDFGSTIHETGMILSRAAAQGELDFTVAEPLHWDEDARCLWQSEAPGEPAQPLLAGTYGPALAETMGKALGSLSRASLPQRDIYDAKWQLERTMVYAQDLAQRLPNANCLIDDLMALFARSHDGLGPQMLRMLHGAPHPHQWLATKTGFSLVDFDRSGHGDSELDIATFVAEVDFSSPKTFAISNINEGFIRGYETIAGPLDPHRFGLYRAHKYVAKALRLARSVRVDGTAKAMSLLNHTVDQFHAICDPIKATRWVLSRAWKQP